jgi:CubicO group peptidase (beta-lactamase class C family)
MIRILLVVLLTFAAAPAVHADEPAIDFTPIEQVLKDEIEADGVPGAVVVIVRDNSVAFAKGFGFASVEEKNPVTPDYLFRVGSTTKMFVGMALVKLAEAGKLKLDEPVSKLIEGLPPALAALTPHQLLTHTAGLADDSVMFGKHDDEALAAGIKNWTDKRFFTIPGDVYSYANPGYWLAGYAAEKAAGKPFADVVANELLAPLGMKRSTFRPTLAMTYPLAQGHELKGGQAAIIRPAADNAANWPAGSLFTSGNDLTRFVMAFLHDGQLEGKQVLAPSLVKTVATPFVRSGARAHYGYGVQISNQRGVELVSHSGSRAGFGSRIVMAPKQKFGVVLLTNRSGAILPKTEAKILEKCCGTAVSLLHFFQRQ